jgi:uncharacterized protein (TIGR02646 family)
MIRVNKTAEIPPSLLVENCNHYDGQDVQDALYSDQHGKCYLCEQETHKNFEIEHLRPKAEGHSPGLEFEWTNLFLSCKYCNGRKPNKLEILNPLKVNIEDVIVHKFDINLGKIEFFSNSVDPTILETIKLLSILFNGKSNIRDIKGKILFDDLNREILNFLKMLIQYKSISNAENKQIIKDLLHISKEFLGFKYWIIKDSGMYDEFKEYMVWNKTL